MNAKKVMAFMAVLIMIACPVAVACSCVDAAESNEVSKTAALIKLDKTSQDKFYNIYSYDTSVIAKIAFIDDSKAGDFKKEITLSNVAMTNGLKTETENLWNSLESVVTVEYDFTLKYTSQKDGAKLTFLNNEYFSGDGIDAYKSFIEKTVNKDQTVEIKGHNVMKTERKTTWNYAEKDGKVLKKDKTAEGYSIQTYNMTIKIDGKTSEIKGSSTEKVNQKATYNYGKTITEVKDYDKYTLNREKTNFDKLDQSISFKVDGSDKSVKIDKDKYKNNTNLISSEEGSASWLEKQYLMVPVLLKNLDVNENLKNSSNDEINTVVKNNGGSTSTNPSDVDSVANSIKNDVNGGSDNTWIWIAVAIVVILIIAAIAIWYFKFRTPPAE